MKVIGITGGAGAGKSQILSYIAAAGGSRIIMADAVGNEVKLPGQPCYERLVSLLGNDILAQDARIDRFKMAERIFSDTALLGAVNAIIHPAVKEYIIAEIDKERSAGMMERFFVEAALLIENGYEKIVDELWYIRADEAVRRKRLRDSRGYTDSKVDAIFASQLPDAVFLRHCGVVIDNSKSLDDTYAQLNILLKQQQAPALPRPVLEAEGAGGLTAGEQELIL